MFHFTKQEKCILSVLGAVIFSGSVIGAVVKAYPQTRRLSAFLEDNKFVRKVNVNSASLDELIELPFIGEFTAGQIIRSREKHGPFKSVDEVRSIKGIREENFNKFKDYLIIR